MTYDDTCPHCKREEKEQSEHDEQIGKFAIMFEEKGYKVETNKGHSNRYMVTIGGNECYPDLVLIDPLDNISIVCEVETENSVNPKAVKQWKSYSSDMYSFYLIVPEDKEDKAKELTESNNIKVAQIFTF